MPYGALKVQLLAEQQRRPWTRREQRRETLMKTRLFQSLGLSRNYSLQGAVLREAQSSENHGRVMLLAAGLARAGRSALPLQR